MNLPEIIRAAIEIGEANGAITFDQLNELIETEKLEPDDIESLFQALGDEGINVVEATTTSPEVACSFCGKSQPDVLQLIAGAGGFICNECVQLCVGIIAGQNPDWLEQHRQFLATLRPNPEG
jgi:hypothetical protein